MTVELALNLLENIQLGGGSFLMKGLIVGGGITGLTVVHALMRVGIQPYLFEKASTRATPHGMLIYKNTLNCFDILNPDVSKEIRKRGAPIKSRTFLKETGKILKSHEIAPDDCYLVHSQDMVDILLEDIPKDSIVTNQEVEDISCFDEKVVLKFKSGKEREGTFVLGCDGVHSTIRRIMFPNVVEFPSDHTIYRGVTFDAVHEIEHGVFADYLVSSTSTHLDQVPSLSIY